MRTVLLLPMIALTLFAQSPDKPAPTVQDAVYGPHERNVLDFWKARSGQPTPLVIYIHGGGFRAGSKDSLSAGVLRSLLDGGISVAAIHYRLVPKHPLPAAHQDARRAIQFLRHKAAEWNIDKSRVGAFGGSAGAQLCMYLAFHDEMARPASQDAVERESTRLTAVATTGGQTTMDMAWWVKNIPGYAAPHRPSTDYFGTANGAEIAGIVGGISALSLISRDDPPIYMSYAMAPDDAVPTDPAKAEGWKVHHVRFGIELQRRMRELGLDAELSHPGARSGSIPGFFLKRLQPRH